MIRKLLFTIAAATLMLVSAGAQGLAGSWWGTLQYPTGALRIVLRLQQKGAEWSAAIDAPDHKIVGMQMPEVRIWADSVSFDYPERGVSYRGAFDGVDINGTFKDNSGELPLKLKRGDATSEYRPQNPYPPYSYKISLGRAYNSVDNQILAGTLTMPDEEVLPKPESGYPAVVLVTGSGPQNRDESIAGHRPFFVLADYLTRHGYAVFRYDDRGTGESTGRFAGYTTEHFKRDAQAALSFLREQPGVDPKRTTILGHSEGGLIAQMIAAEDKDLPLIVMMGGPALRGDSISLLQTEAISKISGVPPAQLAETQKLNLELYKLSADISLDSAALEDAARKYLVTYLDKQFVPAEVQEQIIPSLIAQIQDPWIRNYFRLSPSTYTREINCPVLAFYGEKDLQVVAEPNEKALRANLPKKTLEKSTIETLPSLNHLFQTAPTGNPSEYRTIDETLAPIFLERLVEKLDSHLKP